MLMHFISVVFQFFLTFILPCVILFLFFLVPLALRLPRLGKRELSAFRMFVRFAFVWFCLLTARELPC